MENKIFWILLGKQLSGEITDDEHATLQRLIREDDQDLSYLIEFLEEQWKKKPISNNPSDKKLNERWNSLSGRLFSEDQDIEETKGMTVIPGQSRRIARPAFWYKIAAVILVLFGAAYYFIHIKSPNNALRKHEIVVDNGTKKQIKLSDGTSVWLNAGSKLTYNDEFAESNRNVWLEGEAFFKVKKEAVVPFTVRAKNITIKVLGTIFNVEAYPDEPDIQTTLISGKVQVSLDKDPEKKIVLSPHEKLTVNSGKGKSLKTIDSGEAEMKDHKKLPVLPKANKLKYQVQTLPVNPIDSSYFAETAWVHNKLAFVYEPFGLVAKQMERRYNVHIIFKDKNLKKVVMSGVFEKENIGEALQVLQMITRFDYHIVGDSIYLYK